jgi:hypothetical protein
MTIGEDSQERITVAGKKQKEDQNMTVQDSWRRKPRHDYYSRTSMTAEA